MDSNTQYLIALSCFYKFGPKRLTMLKNHFEDFESAFRASSHDIINVGIDSKLASEFIQWRDAFSLDDVLKQIERENIQILHPAHPDYPPLLQEINDPPAVLYVKGDVRALSASKIISVVGTRKISPYGARHTQKICSELAQSGFCIVSGLALGIDAIAHRTALEAEGRTLAVLATGVNRSSVTPRTNINLYDSIINKGGAVISEFPLGTEGLKHHFPQRNRIIAGLSQATLVIEASIPSGALITAYHALDYNREVLAVPGPIDSIASRGPNDLIKKGAKIILNTSDVLEVYNISVKPGLKSSIKPETKEEKLIIGTLEGGQKHINEIIHLTNLTPSVINSTITQMELKKMIKNVGGMRFVALI